jgi:hypothetical protein
MGERLASELLALIGRAGQDPAHVVLDTELVIANPRNRPVHYREESQLIALINRGMFREVLD